MSDCYATVFLIVIGVVVFEEVCQSEQSSPQGGRVVEVQNQAGGSLSLRSRSQQLPLILSEAWVSLGLGPFKSLEHFKRNKC